MPSVLGVLGWVCMCVCREGGLSLWPTLPRLPVVVTPLVPAPYVPYTSPVSGAAWWSSRCSGPLTYNRSSETAATHLWSSCRLHRSCVYFVLSGSHLRTTSNKAWILNDERIGHSGAHIHTYKYTRPHINIYIYIFYQYILEREIL